MTYYNEIDPFCVQWLKNLINAGHIPNGEIDSRSIEDVRPDDLRGFSGAHFFCGIGGWPFALRIAGIPDDYPVWTGSCPCQPLSSAGLRKGHTDQRHLWPAFYNLIAKCGPPVVFGEQVASKDGREWLAAVRTDLEQLGYACGAADLPAASVGAPHIRQRLWWMAHANRQRQDGEEVYVRLDNQESEAEQLWISGRMADRASIGRGEEYQDCGRGDGGTGSGRTSAGAGDGSSPIRMADTEHNGHTTIIQSGRTQEEGRMLKPERCSGGLADDERERSHAPIPAPGTPIGLHGETVTEDGESRVVNAKGERRQPINRSAQHIQREDRKETGSFATGAGARSPEIGLADPEGKRHKIGEGAKQGMGNAVERHGGSGWMGDTERTDGSRFGPQRISVEPKEEPGRSSYANRWENVRFIGCADRKARPVGQQLLWMANGFSSILEPIFPEANSEERKGTPIDVMRFLSLTMEQVLWQGELEASGVMPHLLESLKGLGMPTSLLSELPKVWRSLTNEDKTRVVVQLVGKEPMWHIINPLTIGEGKGRSGRLRAYGNAIVPDVAAQFIAASFEAIQETRKTDA